MKFAKTLQMTAETLPEEYKGQVLNYKKFKKSINKIVSNLESTGVYEIPENEKCKVIYSLSNTDGNDGEIKSSLILYIDKNYVAELSQKDALELNSEEITIDPKLKEVIELSDNTSMKEEKVTKEKILKSFQVSNTGKNEFIFNKQLPLNRLSRCRSNSNNVDDRITSSPAESGRRNTVFDLSESKGKGLRLKRSKSDGDKMGKFGKQESTILEEKEEELYEKPEDNKESGDVLSSNNNDSINDNQASPSSSINEKEPISNTNNDVKDNIPELDKSRDIITHDTNKLDEISELKDELNKDEIIDDNVVEVDNKNEVEKKDKGKIIIDGEEVDDVIDCTTEENNALTDEAAAANTMKSLQVLLEADAQFLNELAASLSQLSAFQEEYKKIFETKINIMANILSEVSSPYMKDTYRWREILSIYCDSTIWKCGGKDRTPDEVVTQLKLFERKIGSINRRFKTKKSQQLLKEFIQLNYDIVSIKRFYELNQTAVYKILKKHDKRTHLLASEGFPKFARDEAFFNDDIVRSLIYQISSRLLTVIPNPEEYYCPICRDISYKPIRLDCGHLYCLRCLLKAKKLNIRDCPICREPDVIYNADKSNIDYKLMRKMKLEFPREVKEKVNDNRTEKAKEESAQLLQMYGYGNPNQCIVM